MFHSHSIPFSLFSSFNWSTLNKNCQFFWKRPTQVLFLFICVPIEKIVDFSRIRTRIVGVEGKHDDHLTTNATADVWFRTANLWCKKLQWDHYQSQLFDNLCANVVRALSHESLQWSMLYSREDSTFVNYDSLIVLTWKVSILQIENPNLPS